MKNSTKKSSNNNQIVFTIYLPEFESLSKNIETVINSVSNENLSKKSKSQSQNELLKSLKECQQLLMKYDMNQQITSTVIGRKLMYQKSDIDSCIDNKKYLLMSA